MMNHLVNLKLIKFREDIIEYCGWTMNRIGSGTGRIVFELSDELVLKVAKNEAGRRQNEVEAGINDKLCAVTYQHSNNFDWCVMERLYPFDEKEFYVLTGTTYLDRTIWCEHKYIECGHFEPQIIKFVEDRFKSMNENGWSEKMITNNFTSNLVNLMISNDLETGDLTRHDSWGFSKNNPNVPILFDYGLSNNVWTECYKRHDIQLRVGDYKFTCRVVESLDELDNQFVSINFNGNQVMAEKVD